MVALSLSGQTDPFCVNMAQKNGVFRTATIEPPALTAPQYPAGRGEPGGGGGGGGGGRAAHRAAAAATLYAAVSSAPPPPRVQSHVLSGQPARTHIAFFGFPLCLSRACRGKTIIDGINSGEKTVFLPAPIPAPSQQPSSHSSGASTVSADFAPSSMRKRPRHSAAFGCCAVSAVVMSARAACCEPSQGAAASAHCSHCKPPPAPARKRHSLLSAFPMLVPSLSW